MPEVAITGGIVQLDEEDLDLLDVAWHFSQKGYAIRRPRVDGRMTIVFMHRVILERMNFGDSELGDHVNRDRADNRRNNLRPADYSINAQNREVRPSPPCSAPACTRTSRRNGLCETHSARAKRGVSLDAPIRKYSKRGQRT